MIKKTLILMSVSTAFYLQAQNISTITNTVDVYSNTSLGGSAKYNSMAGSNGALGGDATSLLTNPAGLGVAIAGSLSGTATIQQYSNSSTLMGNTKNYNKTSGDLGNVNGVASFQLMTETPWKFVNIGFNYSNQSLDQYVETPGNNKIMISKDLIDNNNNPVTGQLSFLGHAYNRTGNLSKVSLGLASNYDNRIYIGAGLNLHAAKLEQYDTAAFKLNLDNSSADYSKQYTPFSEQSSGLSLNVGFLGRINNAVRLGASIETPTFWSIERVFNYYGFDTNGYVVNKTYTEDRKLTSPLKATLSAALVPSKNFSVNLDYTVGLTKPYYKELGDAEKELNEFFNDKAKNTSEIRVGAEYRIKNFRLRGGYAYASNPFSTISISSYDTSGAVSPNSSYGNLFLGSRSTLGLGLGFDFRSFFIDAAFQNMNSKYQNAFLRGSNSSRTGYYSQDFDVTSSTYAVSEVQNIRNNVSITLGWKF